MNLSRRHFIRLVGSLSAAVALPGLCLALDYPTRPVRLITPFAPGTSADIVARLVGQWLSERLGQPFVIDNKVGAGSSIGTELAVRSAPDGYTLLLITTAQAINATFYKNLPYDFMRDITPVSGVMSVPNILEVNPSVPAKTVPEFIAYLKENPGKLSYATNGLGTSSHVAGELFKMMTGTDMVPVAYRGAPEALQDLTSGRVQAMFDLLPTSLGFIKSGQLRPLAMTTTVRSEALPNIPTLNEFLPGYDASTWMGIGAPANTPPEIIAVLNHAINDGLTDQTMKQRLANIGATELPGPSADFAKFVASETDKWGKVVEFSGAKAE